jgi:hypothetical protein
VLCGSARKAKYAIGWRGCCFLNIQAAGLAEEAEVEAVRKKALRKYKPLTVQLEDGDKTEQP